MNNTTILGRDLRALDIMGLLLLAITSIGGSTFLYGLWGASAFLVPAGGLIRSVWMDLGLPLLRSRPATASEVRDPIFDQLHVRITTTRPTHVVRGVFKNIILLNAMDLEQINGVGRAILLHERAHVENRDLSYFTLNSIIGDSARFALAIALTEIILMFAQQSEFQLSPLILCFAILGGLVFVAPIFRLAQTSLHIREYRADAYAAKIAPDLTHRWLENNVYRDQTRSAWSRFRHGTGFTHPPFFVRLRLIEGKALRFPPLRNRVFLCLYLQAVTLGLAGCVIGAALALESSLNQYPSALGWLTFASGLMALLLGPTYISYEVDRTTRQLGKFKGFILAVVYSSTLYALVCGSGLLWKLHQGDEALPKWDLEFLGELGQLGSVFVVYAVSIFAGNLIRERFLGTFLLLHVVLGVGSWLFAFFVIKSAYAVLFL